MRGVKRNECLIPFMTILTGWGVCPRMASSAPVLAVPNVFVAHGVSASNGYPNLVQNEGEMTFLQRLPESIKARPPMSSMVTAA